MWKNLSSVLEGEVVRLEPLAPRHERGLFAAAGDVRIWRWMSHDAGEGRETFHSWFEDALAASEVGTEAAFATLDARTGEPMGSTRYLALRPEHRGLEIGWTWLAPPTGGRRQRRGQAPHAGARLRAPRGCLRVEFKTDSRNDRSRGALAALPARFEGVFRKHMLVRGGERRDSAYYSIVDDEWSEVAGNLGRRLAAIRGRGGTMRDTETAGGAGRRRATVAGALGLLPGPGGERFARVVEYESIEAAGGGASPK